MAEPGSRELTPKYQPRMMALQATCCQKSMTDIRRMPIFDRFQLRIGDRYPQAKSPEKMVSERPKARDIRAGSARVCVLTGPQAVRRAHQCGMAHACQDGTHAHYKRSKVDAMLTSGDMEWVIEGKVATFRQARSWKRKICAGGGWVGPVMQLVRGGG